MRLGIGFTTRTETGRLLTLASLIWAGIYLACSWVLTHDDVAPGWPSMTLVMLPALVGVGVVMVYLLHLRVLDELQRRIQLEALGLAFGVGVLYAMSFQLYAVVYDTAGKHSQAAAVLLLAWIAGQLLAKWRYK